MRMVVVNFSISNCVYRLLVILLFAIACSSCKPSGTNNTDISDTPDDKTSKVSSLPPRLIKEKSLISIDSMYNTLPNPTIRDLCTKYQLKSIYFFETSDYSKAMLYADSILTIIQNNGLQTRLAVFYGKAHLIKGDILMALNDYHNAFQYYYEGKREIEVTHDTCIYAEYATKLGNACYKQGNYLDAAHYFKEGFNVLAHCRSDQENKFHYQQANLDNAALCYDKFGMPDSAIYYYLQALDYIDHHENEFAGKKSVEIDKGVIYGNLATSYYKIGKLPIAETLFKKSIIINTQKGYDNADAQLTQLKLADLYLKTSRLNEAKNILEKIKGTLDTSAANKKQNRSQNIEARLYKLQSDYYAHVHNPAVANTYLNAYIALKDSIDETNKKLAGTDFNKEYENIENKYAFAVLKKNDKHKTIYLVISVIIGIMAIVITVLIWQNTKKLRKLNEKISTQNAEMQTAITALEHSQDENNRMMKIVSHDLRSPIAGIISITSIMLKEDLKDEHKQMLGMVKTSCANAIEFINDLIHVNATLKEMIIEPVEVAPLLQHCVDLLQFKAKEKKQEIILKKESVTIPINRQKIWRVITNLLSNAIKFSPTGKNILVYMKVMPDRLLIAVKDHGIGIPADLKSDIFNMFTRATRLGTNGEQSFGLGLGISMQIVKAHNGRMWFESEPGKGTTFFIELPVKLPGQMD